MEYEMIKHIQYEGRSKSFFPDLLLEGVETWNFYQLLVLLYVWSSKSNTFLPAILDLSNTLFVESTVFTQKELFSYLNDVIIIIEMKWNYPARWTSVWETGKSLKVLNQVNKAGEAVFHSHIL